MLPLEFYFFGIILIVTMATGVYLWKKRKSGVKQDTLNLRLLSIRLPREEDEEGRGARGEEIVRQIAQSEQLYASLAAVGEPFVFEVAVHHSGEDIHFYCAVPRTHADFFARQVQGVFLEAQVEQVGDYTIFSPDCKAAAAHMHQKENFVLPIRTYRESESDSFGPILSSLSKLAAEGEGAALQMVAFPADSKTKKAILGGIESLRKGDKLKDILDTRLISGKEIAKLGKEFIMPGKNKNDDKPKDAPIIDDDAVKALQQKVTKPLFRVNVRLVTAAANKDRAEDLLLSMVSSFSQFSAPQRNSIEYIKATEAKQLLYQYAFREFSGEEAMLLNTEEMASLFHLPTASSAVPHVRWLKNKEAPPPENLPKEGIILGESQFRGERRLVRMTDEDRRRHLYIVGQTGTGKTVTLASLAAQDILAGKGLCIMDPNTDFFNDMISLVPKERVEDVIIFDPSDLTRPMGLNMLEFDTAHPEQRSFVINEMLGIFDRLYDLKSTGGPMFELYLRNALLLLTEDFANEPATLIEVQRLFVDDEFRNRKLARSKDPLVIGFWENAAKRTGDGSLPNMTTYITSKFTQFVNNDYMRPIIGQPTSSINFREIMDQGKILFVNLPKGLIGDMNANLLGMVIVGKLLMAAFSRVDQEMADRRDFYLYMDEFQNFTTDSIATILSEARKYRLDLIIGHQYIAQLQENIRDAVFGNVGSMLALRVGAPDTEVLAKQFEPVFTPRDLITVDNLCGHAKILVDGQPARPFSMKLIFPPRGSKEVREKLKELSRLVHGRDRAAVEADIFSRLKV
ncbi:MAG: hypothetical protein COV10_03745 [Candidatus Vogelbacteria bacterium CG10_big_fil_rev_8_21_14_0_10_51_16]|uniref:Uncharacterized protein n=1 Tax=Candidatus Vogelbacteria bacterium CG10_big_fil_rev_8_21_14_0_10_51_16 TaxID=1975045 RepID=A0A2H0RDH6_9BACT|nr:MAG: hypothetical protein COV10_03745 [Candidatus Vogelbacteria bacterium CG10_big_fil_rev_8_21_14_0_10_51_16]